MKDNYNKFRYYREKSGLTQKEISFALGISKNTYVSYELGRNEAPYTILLKLSSTYGVSINDLLSDNGAENENEDLLVLFKSLPEERKRSLMDFLNFLADKQDH